MIPKTRFLKNDALTRKRWARDLFRVILPAVEFNWMTGKGSDAAVQIRTELGKGEGDEVTFGIRLPLVGQGTVGDRTVEGTEEKLRFRDFKASIEELNHAVDTGGKMEQQRVPYDLMMEGKDALADWWVDRLSDLVVNTVIGNSSFVFCGQSMDATATAFGNVIEEPDSDHHLIMNDKANEAALDSSDTIDLAFLDALKQRAEIPPAGSFKVRPLRLGGRNYYRVLMHNYVFDALRQNTNVGEWGDLLRAANKLQMPEVEISYNGLLVTKVERMPQIIQDSSDAYQGVYRTALIGAQGAVWAWGGAGESKSSVMTFVPYEKDAKRYVMIRGGGIFGCKKTRFEEKDYGIIVGSTWGARLQ